MQESSTAQNAKRPSRRLKLLRIWITVFSLSGIFVLMGCGFHHLLSYSPKPDDWDYRIPGWKVKLQIYHIYQKETHPPYDLSFDLEADPLQKNPSVLLGLDSIMVMIVFEGHQDFQSHGCFVFPLWFSEPDDRIRAFKDLGFIPELPKKMTCITYFTVKHAETDLTEQIELRFPLIFRKKKRFWLGT